MVHIIVNKRKLLVVQICETCHRCYTEGSRNERNNGCEFDFISVEASCQASIR